LSIVITVLGIFHTFETAFEGFGVGPLFSVDPHLRLEGWSLLNPCWSVVEANWLGPSGNTLQPSELVGWTPVCSHLGLVTWPMWVHTCG